MGLSSTMVAIVAIVAMAASTKEAPQDPQVIQPLYFQRVGLQQLRCLVKGLKSLCQLGLRATKSEPPFLATLLKLDLASWSWLQLYITWAIVK